MSTRKLPDGVVAYEAKNISYQRSLRDYNDDCLLIKELIHKKDGTYDTNLKLLRNHPRDFYITKKAFRTYKEKKDYESKDKLERYTTTQARLPEAISRVLNIRGAESRSLRTICRNPYVYGADTPTTVLVKKRYQDAFPGVFTPNTYAAFDVETNVLHEGDEPGDIILGSVTMKDKVYLGIDTKFIANTYENRKKLDDAFELYLGDLLRERGIKTEYDFQDSQGAIASNMLRSAHAWKPDFLAAWSVEYDLNRIINAFEQEGYDVGNEFSDPIVPREFRRARFIEGSPGRTTASGHYMSFHQSQRWHVMDCMSSFYIACAMATYRSIRAAKGNLPSYSLQAILERELDIGKLKFDKLVLSDGKKWHVEMQRNYPIEYTVYNVFDCIAMELLEEHTRDFTTTISALLGYSHPSTFPSQPKRLANNFSFVCEENSAVMGTTSDQMKIDLDNKVVQTSDWIVTLDSLRMQDVGIQLFDNLPSVRSGTYIMVADLDCVSTYPKAEAALNSGKTTTKYEFSKFHGLNYEQQCELSLNSVAGSVNALEIMQTVCNYPTHDDIFSAFTLSSANDTNNVVTFPTPEPLFDPYEKEAA